MTNGDSGSLRREGWWASLAALGLLFVLVVLVYGLGEDVWWRFDDPAHLRFVAEYRARDFLTDPATWQIISPANFTPLLSLSYALDLAWHGLWPQGFYLRHAMMVFLAAAVSFAFLRLWVTPAWAFVGAVLFLVGVPVLYVAEQLAARHYIEGLVLFVSALYLYIRACRGQRWLVLPGALLYLLAMMAKEVYIPLIALLPFLREGDLRSRILLAMPFLAAFAAFVIWRSWMLGGSLGGYAPFETLSALQVIREFAQIPALLFGGTIPALLVFLGLLGYLALGWSRALREVSPGELQLRLLLFVVATGLLMIPLVPLTAWPGIQAADRYLLLPWWAFSMAMAWWFSIAYHGSRLATWVMMCFLLGFVLQNHWRISGYLEQEIAAREVQGRFVWDRDADAAIWLSEGMAGAYWDVLALARLKRLKEGGAGVPLAFLDEIQVEGYTGDNLWRYDAGCRCMRNVAPDMDILLADWRDRRQDRKIDIDVHFDGKSVSWSLGPERAGQYRVIGAQLGRIAIPPEGVLRRRVVPGTLVVRYDAPEGWIAYSLPVQIGSGRHQGSAD